MRGIKTVSIIGVGLIGGSLGMALKSRKLVNKVIGIGRNPQKLEKALKLNAVDEITTDFGTGVKDADVVVICTPVGLIIPILKNILPLVKKNCIITDVGSVKGPVVKEAQRLLKGKTVFFIGGHPMAGSERTGIEFAHAVLFKDAVWVLTPSLSISARVVKKLDAFVSSTGAHTLHLQPAQHDRIVACTSHLPHLLAVALIHSVGQQTKRDAHTKEMTAGSFRDVTRIASSGPEIWKDIFLMNKKEIISACAIFNKITQKMLAALQQNDEKAMYALFAQARIWRDSMMQTHGKANHTEAE